MEQIAAKVASLVVPPAQQHRGELVVEKPSEEKGRQPGEARRRRPLERSTVEVKGAGGILVLGGLLVTAAVAAGVTIVARRAQAKRPPGSKKEKVEGLNGNDKLGESRIDGSAGIQEEDDCVSVKPKSSSSETVTCDGVEELRNGRELGWQQLDEKNWGKTDLGLQNGIGKKEIDKQVSLGDKESELGMNQQQSEGLVNAVLEEEEEEDKETSPVEAEDSVNHYETELKESVPASGNGEKEDEPSLKQPHVVDAESIPEIEISKQGCESVRDRDEKVFPFLEESNESQFEMAGCKFNVSRPLGPLTFKEIVEQQKVEASPSELEEEARPQMDVSEQQTAQVIDEHKQQKEHEILTVESEDKVNQHQTEQISESELALVNEEKEPKEPQFHMIESVAFALKEDKKELSVEHVLNEYGIVKIEEHIEEKEEAEASPEGEEKTEDLEAIEEKKELESSVEGEDDGTYSNQTQPHIIHSEVSTEEFSATKETEEKVQPVSFAEEEEGSNNNQTQTEQVIDEHKQQKEHEILTVESEHKVNQYQTEQISGSELALVNEEKEPKEARFHMTESEPFALKEDEKEEVKALSVGQQTEHVLNENDLTKIEERVEEKEETEASPGGNEEKKEEEESPEGEEDEEEIEDEKEPETSPEEEEKVEDEEVIEEKKVPESFVGGEDDGTYNNQTQPHIIHDEVSTEEFSTTKETEETDEKNQTQTITAGPQFITENHSTVKQVEKMDNEKEDPESFPEEEAQMGDEGSDSAPVSYAQESYESSISPAEVVDQGKIILQEVQSKASSDYLISSREVKVKVHVKKVEEKQQESIAEREDIPNNMVHANKAEEKEEESMIGREKITKDDMQEQLMGTIKKKALKLEKLLMDIPDRLLVVLLVISLTMVLLHYVKPFSQPYQMISSPSDENPKGI